MESQHRRKQNKRECRIRIALDDHTRTLGVWNNTSMVVEEGEWIMADKNGQAYDHGKYLILWKIENGKWKKFRDCHNSDIYPK